MPVPTLSEEKHNSPDLTTGSHGNNRSHKKRKGASKQSKTGSSHLNLDVQLVEAVGLGKCRVVRRLLDSHANPNHTNDQGQTPVMLACSLQEADSRTTILHLLLHKGADLNMQDQRGMTVLMAAVKQGDEEMVQFLLSHNCDVGKVDNSGNNVLSHASETGNDQIVLTLVQEFKRQKVNIDNQNNQGLTPLLIACQGGHREIAHILVAKGGASPMIRDLDHFMNAQEWIRLSGFHTDEQLLFLSPSTLKRNYYRREKGIRTLHDCVAPSDHLDGCDSPNVFTLRRRGSDGDPSHLPDLDMSSTNSAQMMASRRKSSHRVHDRDLSKSMFSSGKSMFSPGKSMFDIPRTSASSKTPGFALGCPVPAKPTSHSNNPFQTIKGDLYSSSYITHRKSLLSQNPRSGLYHSGALDPLEKTSPRGQRSNESTYKQNDKMSSHGNRKGKHDLLPPIKR